MKKNLLMLLILCIAVLAIEAQEVAANKQNSAGNLIYDMISVDQQAEFNGGINKFYQFLFRNINLSTVDSNYMGSMIPVSFVIEKNGAITNVKADKPAFPKIEAEIIKALKKSPKWKPALVNNKPVRLKFSVAPRFELQ